MLVNNEEGSNLLFIMPFVNETTMLYYKDGKKEIYDGTVKKFFSTQQHAIVLLSPMLLYEQIFIATCSPRNPQCVWVNTIIIKEHDLYQLCLQAQQYGIEINVEKLVHTYLKAIKKQIV